MKQSRAGTWTLLVSVAATGILTAAAGHSIQVPAGGTAASAVTPDPPLSDTRLTVHTLVREDLFAGFLRGDMNHFVRGEKNIDLLLDQRSDQKANLLAWKGSAIFYRAVRAHEGHDTTEYQRLHRQAMDLFSQASAFKTGNEGVDAVRGGTCVLFAERLPKADRAAAWALAYDAYHALVKQQDSVLDKLPVHFRGEILGGLATAAARTGRAQESAQTVDKMLVVMRDTVYEPAARQWKESHGAASNPNMTCLSCHTPGRLAARLDTVNKK